MRADTRGMQRLRIFALTLAAGVALALGAGGCGGGSTAPPASAGTPTSIPTTVNTDNPISKARTVVTAQNQQLQQEEQQTGG